MKYTISERAEYSKQETQNTEILEIPGISFFNKISFSNLLIKKFFNILSGKIVILRDLQEKNSFSNIIDNANIVAYSGAPLRHDSPKIHGFLIKYQKGNQNFFSTGYSLKDVNLARLKAFGEYLERYSSFLSTEETANLKLQKFNKKKIDFNLDDLPKPDPDSFFSKIFPKNLNDFPAEEWLYAKELLTGKYSLLPKSFTYWYKTKDDEKITHNLTTNACGAGVSFERACLSAIYEAVERDHFLLYWLSGVKPDLITNDSLPKEFSNHIIHIEKKYNLNIYFLNTSWEMEIFSCICVIEDRINNLITFAGSASFSPFISIEKSFEESLAAFHQTHNTKPIFDPISIRENIHKIDRVTRENMYNNPEGLEIINKIFLTGKKVEFHQVESFYQKNFKDSVSELEQVVKNFKKKNNSKYKIFIYNFENEVLKKYNYYVVRAFIPGFYKLWLSEKYATPLSERLNYFYKEKTNQSADVLKINTLPHPFP